MEIPRISSLPPDDTSLNKYDDLQLNVRDEKAEIASLKLPAAETITTEHQNDDHKPKILFQCSACCMKEVVHYYGKNPQFVYGLKLLEDSFVMRDPFQPTPIRWKPKAEYFIVVGAKCSVCKNVVCKDAECSFYFTLTYCLSCVESNMNKFPIEAQAKLRKQLARK
ncbi:PREDICTED: cysteine-rich DPF motif domain-containing protein 1 [Rhagoletis zephyria]|uniref:cysteine-rich DPF motif domain-containing protein 1 n=1 Tax=Rhagoletis zephyria TaxID=28612 RepID=UPI00081142AF|nr:PREDICTED: cysteine-rich DPF motif domain-containing protein 1 [Rhagoletis zephyria]